MKHMYLLVWLNYYSYGFQVFADLEAAQEAVNGLGSNVQWTIIKLDKEGTK